MEQDETLTDPLVLNCWTACSNISHNFLLNWTMNDVKFTVLNKQWKCRQEGRKESASFYIKRIENRM